MRTSLHTQPLYIDRAAQLIDVLKQKSPSELSKLMKLSDALATLNAQRYASWEPVFTQGNSRQAVLAFNGDVYEGLDASTLSDAKLQWAQKHVALLSGLYGVLRPLDLMQPYRLEMGTPLVTGKSRNLYQFWGATIAEHLNGLLAELPRRSKGPRDLVLNLASEEYFKSVDLKALKADVAQCVFQDNKNGVWKVISFNAKRARGLMARYIIDNKITKLEDLRDFDGGGYVFDGDASEEDKLVFRRPS
ncbi:MAG TPA: peroxide stress protein YaaA [Burkholderiaceae bacterium]|nr:peroxide stress protein YaaA [Burkholderiaceae bacterium]